MWYGFGYNSSVVMNDFRKSFLTLMLLMLNALWCLGEGTQSVDETVQSFKSSINRRDTKLLSSILDNNIELTFNNTHNTYARGHAVIILNDFYLKNKPIFFKVDFRGSYPNMEDQYIIGTATTQTGNFKIYLYLKSKEGRFVIQELKIGKS
jgi:hypothetical protein